MSVIPLNMNIVVRGHPNVFLTPIINRDIVPKKDVTICAVFTLIRANAYAWSSSRITGIVIPKHGLVRIGAQLDKTRMISSVVMIKCKCA